MICTSLPLLFSFVQRTFNIIAGNWPLKFSHHVPFERLLLKTCSLGLPIAEQSERDLQRNLAKIYPIQPENQPLKDGLTLRPISRQIKLNSAQKSTMFNIVQLQEIFQVHLNIKSCFFNPLLLEVEKRRKAITFLYTLAGIKKITLW